MTNNERRALFLLFVTAAVILAAGLGLRDPWPADEPRFALIARDMVESGNWLLPKVGRVLYPDKPPLHFWSVAALYSITGSLRFSFLFPAFVAGIGVLILVVDLGRRLWGGAAGIWCGAVLLSLIQFPLQMKSGQLDGPLCFWTTLALYGFCRHILLGPSWTWYAVGGAAAGLGIITKGVGFLPYLVFLPYAYAAFRSWEIPVIDWRNLRWLVAPALTLFAVGLWLVPMLIATAKGTDPATIDYRNNILFHQTVTRYADSWGHIKPPWYLLTNAIPWLWLPATLLLPWLGRAWWADVSNKRNLAALILGLWVVLVVLFFSISAGKRSVYVFPAAPAFALIVGSYMPALVRKVGVRWVLGIFPMILGLTMVTVGMYGLMHPHELHEWLPDTLVIVEMMLSLLLVGLLSLVFGVFSVRRHPLLGTALSLASFWLVLSLLINPQINVDRSGERLVANAEAALSPDAELGLAGWPEQFLLYIERPVTHFGYRRNDREGETADAIRWLVASPSRYILLPAHWSEQCFDKDDVVEIGRAHRRDWVVVSRSSILSGCVPDAADKPRLAIEYSSNAATSRLAYGGRAAVGPPEAKSSQ